MGPFKELLSGLRSTDGVPPVSAIVADGVMGFCVQAGREMGIRVVQFWTASACGFMGYLQYPELVKRGIVPFKGTTFIHSFTYW